MIVDANLLIYASNTDDRRYQQAASWLQDALNGDARIGLPWTSLGAFLRVSTNARIFRTPFTSEQAWAQVEEWLDAPRAWVPEPTSRYRVIVGRLVRDHRIGGPLVTDAMLAALAIDHGVALASTDGDFARFDGLTWVNPLRG